MTNFTKASVTMLRKRRQHAVNDVRDKLTKIQKLTINNNNNNIQDNVYGAVIMAEPLREFTRFI